MKTIARNGKYQLVYTARAANRFAVYLETSISPSGELVLKTMVAKSPIFSKKIKSYFTPSQIQNAIAKVHTIDYAEQKCIA